MWRSVLRALGAALLWFASAAGANATSETDPVAGVQPPAIRLGAAAPSVNLNRQAVYWLDAQGSRTIEQVEAAADSLPWLLRRRDSQGPVHGGALWILFEATVPAGEHWYLEVSAPFHEKVQLFHRDATGRLVAQEAGTVHSVAEWAVPGRLPTFRLAGNDPRPVRYWLRVEDDRSDFVAPLMLMREDALQQAREREQFVFGAYFGLAGLVAIAALANGLAFRDKAFLAFALYIVLLGAGQLGRAGIGAQHVWPEWQVWNDTVLALWPGAATAAALWFVKVVTEPARLSRALDASAWGLIAALLGATAVHVVIGSWTSMALVLALTGLSLIAVLSMVTWGWLGGRDRHLGLFALGFAPVLVLAAFPLARSFGLLPTNLVTRFGLFFGAALELPILYYALNLRLMARREADLRASALSRTDALTGLPHRQAIIERLDTSLAHARGQKQNCALLGVRISNLDAIAEEFGREAAEKALVVAASHLRRTIVNFDMAARVDQREFAVLLEAPMTPQTVTSRAQQLVASGLRQIEALPAALTLKFHVTAAMLPVPELDGEASLAWVIDGLDQMNQEVRKLIRPLNF
ncbi:sensor domain-containing diguanylate cyclase [Ramlibacter montanisoli]|uniref:Diguanylate cyclase n=1 Tax=Ramlibacter montanisoli TaxID=2732512 RepID=A0A849K7S0_9BURK|nr:7TM diverse intracellular signaling domain-containing protein [Ramlibacter montanisoli]NNU44398.1 diguanylate cyclase [Ramlibacter montanisoli]